MFLSFISAIPTINEASLWFKDKNQTQNKLFYCLEDEEKELGCPDQSPLGAGWRPWVPFTLGMWVALDIHLPPRS